MDGVTLNGGHLRVPANRDGFVHGVAYLSAARIKHVPALCFQANGGSMLGFGFKTNVVRLRG